MNPPKRLICTVEYFLDGEYKSFPIYNEIVYNLENHDKTIEDDIIIGWCNGSHYKTLEVAENNSDTVRSVYLSCLNKARQYIEAHFNEWRLGGTGVVVLVEIIPIKIEINGTTKTADEVIIAFAEVAVIPRYYFGTLKTADNNMDKRAFILQLIKKVLKPGSVLVLNDFLFKHCKQPLRGYFLKIMDIHMLANSNIVAENIYEQRNTIWDSIITRCDNASEVFDIENVLMSIMWLQRFYEDSYLKLVEN